MNASHKQAMAAGRARAQREREQRSVERVRAFVSWLKRGGRIPEIPSDADWGIARRRGIVR